MIKYMKKILIGICAALAVLGGTAFAFQGMAVRLAHWDEFKLIEHNEAADISQKTYDIPDDWQEYELKGIRFKAPSGLEYDENDGCYTDILSSDENYRNGTTARNIGIFAETVNGNGDFMPLADMDKLLAEFDISADDLRSFCDWSGRAYPQDGIDFWLMGADLNMDDFNIHSYKNARTFFKIGEEMANWGTLGSARSYKRNTDQYKAFVYQAVRKEPLEFEPFATMRLLDKSGNEAFFSAATGNEEQDMAIVSTVKLD